jgi:hypothetical protein
MKIASKITIPLFLIIATLTSCSGFSAAFKTGPTKVMETTPSIPGTALAETQTAIPTNTPSPTIAAYFNEQQVIGIAWQALEPNTSSHNQNAWESVVVGSFIGRDIQDKFEGEPIPGHCAPGPTPPDNAKITPDAAYWYVQMQPRPATPGPLPTNLQSPTAPPNVPEPFVYKADFLIDAGTGQIVARKLYCVIY